MDTTNPLLILMEKSANELIDAMHQPDFQPDDSAAYMAKKINVKEEDWQELEDRVVSAVGLSLIIGRNPTIVLRSMITAIVELGYDLRATQELEGKVKLD